MLDPVKCPDCGVWWRSYAHHCKASSQLNVSGPPLTVSGPLLEYDSNINMGSINQDPNITYNVINTFNHALNTFNQGKVSPYYIPPSDEPPVGSIVLCGCKNVVYFRKYDVIEGWVGTDHSDKEFMTWEGISSSHDEEKLNIVYVPSLNLDCEPHMYYTDEDVIVMAIKYGMSSENKDLNKRASQLSWEYWHSFSEATRNVIIEHVHFSLEMNPLLDWQEWEWLYTLQWEDE